MSTIFKNNLDTPKILFSHETIETRKMYLNDCLGRLTECLIIEDENACFSIEEQYKIKEMISFIEMAKEARWISMNRTFSILP